MILKHLGLWLVTRKPQPRANAPPIELHRSRPLPNSFTATLNTLILIPRASGQLGARGVFVLELRLQVRGNEDEEGSQQKGPCSMVPRGAMSPYGSAVVHPGSMHASPGVSLSIPDQPKGVKREGAHLWMVSPSITRTTWTTAESPWDATGAGRRVNSNPSHNHREIMALAYLLR